MKNKESVLGSLDHLTFLGFFPRASSDSLFPGMERSGQAEVQLGVIPLSLGLQDGRALGSIPGGIWKV